MMKRTLLTRSLSESTDCVMSLYLGTSAKSLSYVGCRAKSVSDLLHNADGTQAIWCIHHPLGEKSMQPVTGRRSPAYTTCDSLISGVELPGHVSNIRPRQTPHSAKCQRYGLT